MRIARLTSLSTIGVLLTALACDTVPREPASLEAVLVADSAGVRML